MVAPAFSQPLLELLAVALHEMDGSLERAERMARWCLLLALVGGGVHRGERSEPVPDLGRQVLPRRVETMLHPVVPGVHAPVASLADYRAGGAVDDRGSVDEGDHAALLHPVEEGDEADFGMSAYRARRERAAFEGTDARRPRGLIAARELLERRGGVLYVDGRTERGSNAARHGPEVGVWGCRRMLRHV